MQLVDIEVSQNCGGGHLDWVGRKIQKGETLPDLCKECHFLHQCMNYQLSSIVGGGDFLPGTLPEHKIVAQMEKVFFMKAEGEISESVFHTLMMQAERALQAISSERSSTVN